MTTAIKRRRYGANLLLAAVLFVTPWALDFRWQTVPAWNAWVSGAIIGTLAILAMKSFAEWEEWLELLTGLWVAASPWVLDFAANTKQTWAHIVLGVGVAAIAAGELRNAYQQPRALT